MLAQFYVKTNRQQEALQQYASALLSPTASIKSLGALDYI